MTTTGTPHKSKAAATVRPVPAGCTAVTPWIISSDTSKLFEFMKKAFGARETARVPSADGSRIDHAEFCIGDAVVMAFDTRPEWPETPGFLRLFVDDADAVYQKALDAGATSVTRVTPMFFGDRVGRVRDPLGNIWWIQTHTEDVDPADMQRRAADEKNVEAMAYVQKSLEQAMAHGAPPKAR
jgi:PhnB protein